MVITRCFYHKLLFYPYLLQLFLVCRLLKSSEAAVIAVFKLLLQQDSYTLHLLFYFDSLR